MSQVLERLLAAQRTGEWLPDEVLADYAEQLTRVQADRERMEQVIAEMWRIVGKAESH